MKKRTKIKTLKLQKIQISNLNMSTIEGGAGRLWGARGFITSCKTCRSDKNIICFIGR